MADSAVDPTSRASCRRQAALWRRAWPWPAILGLGAVSLVRFFRPEEVELLARMEHARWNAERFLGGWTLGPRDPARRTTPHLVDWKDLPEEIREYDREAVRHIPHLLEILGERIYRRSGC